MKRISEISWRIIVVAYVLLFLGGALFALFVWTINKPYSYNTYSYLVTCYNGKTFDPTSKPIDKEDYSEPYRFSVNQLKAECEYGDAFLVGLSQSLPRNFTVGHQMHIHTGTTRQEQMSNTIIWIGIYYLLLEVIRRTFMFIFFGKNFLTLKSTIRKKGRQ